MERFSKEFYKGKSKMGYAHWIFGSRGSPFEKTFFKKA